MRVDLRVTLLRDTDKPLPTAEIAERIGLSRYDGRAWTVLHGMELDGHVTCHRDSTKRAVFWSSSN
ncbi:MAG: hypothetical protein ACRDT6_00175 [Micromonosporaceae bacterium]